MIRWKSYKSSKRKQIAQETDLRRMIKSFDILISRSSSVWWIWLGAWHFNILDFGNNQQLLFYKRNAHFVCWKTVSGCRLNVWHATSIRSHNTQHSLTNVNQRAGSVTSVGTLWFESQFSTQVEIDLRQSKYQNPPGLLLLAPSSFFFFATPHLLWFPD